MSIKKHWSDIGYIAAIILVIVFLGYGGVLFDNKAQETRAIHQAEYDSRQALDYEYVAMVAKTCQSGGLRAKLHTIHNPSNFDDTKTVAITCAEPLQPTSTGDGIADAAAIGATVYVADKLLRGL